MRRASDCASDVEGLNASGRAPLSRGAPQLDRLSGRRSTGAGQFCDTAKVPPPGGDTWTVNVYCVVDGLFAEPPAQAI
jgi:hypothetical protein